MGKPDITMRRRTSGRMPRSRSPAQRGDNDDFCPGLKRLQVRERPFRTIKNFFIARFVAQASPVAGDLLNQFPSAALHAHGKLLSRNYLPALCRHYFCLF